MSRRKGRILAFQALYAREAGAEAELLYSFSWAEPESLEKTGETGLTFARLLVAGTIEHMVEIDDVIKTHLQKNWDFSRLNKVDLAILRISVFPLLYQKDLHPTIVIDEAVSIAKIYSGDESYKFINAILDAIRKDVCAA
ncbi:MAG: transcription antitermination factor NusB [Treponema sp.]|jgi:N utilization substance protein B|nr:transcription antitermination factor NusB [Treponema sp.]